MQRLGGKYVSPDTASPKTQHRCRHHNELWQSPPVVRLFSFRSPKETSRALPGIRTELSGQWTATGWGGGVQVPIPFGLTGDNPATQNNEVNPPKRRNCRYFSKKMSNCEESPLDLTLDIPRLLRPETKPPPTIADNQKGQQGGPRCFRSSASRVIRSRKVSSRRNAAAGEAPHPGSAHLAGEGRGWGWG